MAEYIDKEALFAEFDRLGLGENSFVEKIFSDGVRTIIACMPAAEVVPVVRCKDCKFWDFGDCYRLELSRPDDFCSYGKRKAE